MSFFVFFLYASKAAVKIVLKVGEEVVLGGTWDMVFVDRVWLDDRKRARSTGATVGTSCLASYGHYGIIAALNFLQHFFFF